MFKVAFLGDVSLNDDYTDLHRRGIDPFINIRSTLSDQDFVIANLECMAKGDEGENLLRRPRLTTTYETLAYLKALNVSLVTLAQNHVYDHLEDGYRKTTEFLTKNDITYMGAGHSHEEAREPIIIFRDRIKIGLLNYVSEDTNPNLPENSNVFTNFFDLDRTISEITNLKTTVDHVVVMLHWGGRVEGGYYPDWNQPSIARKLIDAGADLLIGHHSHTLQPFEKYRGKFIFYSLGNFCFSDIKFENRVIEIDRKKNVESIIVLVNFTKKKYTIELLPIENKECWISKEPSILQRLKYRNRVFYFIRESYILWKIYFFKLKKIDPALFYFFGNSRNFFSQFRILAREKWKSKKRELK